jgi:hypothetical protein
MLAGSMLHAIAVRPQSSRRHEAGLGCTVSHVYGYRAVCSCGWRGRVRGSVSGARADGLDHRAGSSTA